PALGAGPGVGSPSHCLANGGPRRIRPRPEPESWPRTGRINPCWHLARMLLDRKARSGSNMVDRNLLREFDVSDEELATAVAADGGDMDRFLGAGQNFEVNGIVAGKVIEIVGDQVVVDVGYKSEGLVPLSEWDEEAPPRPGDAVEVLLEGMEDETGEI